MDCIDSDLQLKHFKKALSTFKDLWESGVLRELVLLEKKVSNPIIHFAVLNDISNKCNTKLFKETVLKYVSNGSCPVEVAELLLQDYYNELVLASI